ncbi:Conserved oligomeric Golgi complex subunit 8 Short=COG complex subunit 8; AltName: Full=Component of oligomeric Golgi complex 8 [Cyberlindnera jadinii]|uniref:Conserved oligomeric Golgi complex subunit 8 n=1 Tax=Cyberlindnera jadinii (strain ATCC 18201 / CBS 1600 / BCRC 20928 / JCM 3617 / NBRC 0987 / NRRL Y-1542) TaxID=983966 RepID=A0A0H5C1S8_CYBJN|nr:Conserved oligomeric Golgi complex subunit 8 Short=COG complex subunit 8; AltName: Full=Component of oligomeric Golgi complex 8 [Cyberlindnera jadinii]
MSHSGEIDTASLDVLLQELSGDLPKEVSPLLEDEELRGEILRYLNDISCIDSKEYLSSVPPTPASGFFTQEDRTLVQDIAELEAQGRSIETQLKSLIVQSQESIVQTKTQLNDAEVLFETQFSAIFNSIWRTFNEDELEEVKDQDQELYSLETDLNPEDNDSTFQSVVANVKNLIHENDETNKNLSIVLENMDQIINILDLPSLTGLCVKAGYYAEALEISSYTRRLAIRFPFSDLIREVESGIKNEMSQMLIGLIRLLRTNLKQSSIIKIMSYLRRIPPFSQVKDCDSQLKRIMLHTRYQFIKLELESLKPLNEGGMHEKYLKRSIELIREYGFSSIMTFKNFVSHILLELITSLQSSLPLVSETSIRDGLYLQLIYCAQSLGRIDSNFSDLTTALLLNARTQDNSAFLMDRKVWRRASHKQRQLANTFN